MKDKMDVVVFIGDVHGEWGSLDTVVEEAIRLSTHHPLGIKFNIVKFVQLGDFGYYPRDKDENLPKLKDWSKVLPDCEFLFIRGNHEDHESWLSEMEGVTEPKHSCMKCYYPWKMVPDGYVDEHGILYIGGAKSLDSDIIYRKVIESRYAMEGKEFLHKWFYQEQLTIDQFMKIIDKLDYKSIKCVATHDCRQSYAEVFEYRNNEKSVTGQALDAIYEKINAARRTPHWFHGHHHRRMREGLDQSLDMLPCSAMMNRMAVDEIAEIMSDTMYFYKLS